MLNVKINRQLKLILCTCLLSCNQFIVGCSFVFSSILLAKLNDSTSTIKINSDDASWIASVPILVCPIGLLIIGVLIDKIGRRKALQVANIPLIVSWLVLAYANSLKMIIIGRIIFGISMGLGTCTYVYLAEICPAKNRPLYFSIVTIFVGVGMITECILSMFFHWHTVSVLLFAISSVSCLSLFAVPETPMWLRTQGRIAEAEAAEKWLSMEQSPVAATAAAIATIPTVDGDDLQCDNTRRQSAIAYWRLFVKPTVWKPTLISLTFFICQQGCAIYVLLFYSVDVLRDFQVQWDGITVTAFLCASRVLGSLVFSSLHHVKRKTLTVVSSAGMGTSLIVIVAYMRMYKDVADPPYGMLMVVSFIVYVFFALLAMLPLPWTICGELFPMTVKGTMNGVVQFFGYEIMFIVIKLYPALVSNYGIENVWSVFAGFCLASVIFGAFIMPETKGKSLDDILKSFETRQKSLSGHQ